MKQRNKSANKYTMIIVSLLILIGCLIAFIYLSPQFEQNKPKVYFEENVYWNLKDKLKLKLVDDSGIKFYRVVLKSAKNETVLHDEVLEKSKSMIDIDIVAPELNMFFKNENISIVVEAVDDSKWNFLEGNKIVKEFHINIDTKKPFVDVIANTYTITRGGSALVVVKVKDENLKESYISFGNKTKFELIPFYKKNYYLALIAWDVKIEDFAQINLIAIDKANNYSSYKIPFYTRKLKNNESRIKITKSFIENISSKVILQSSKEVPLSLKDVFIVQNKDIRALNIETIRSAVLQKMNKTIVNNFNLGRFNRLINSVATGTYAQKRSYYFENKKIDTAWHLGMDFASVKRASIRVSNDGKVIFNDYLGIYGNTVIIDHNFGLQSLYAHLSISNVNLEQSVKRGYKIGNTGVSGAVLGDHLHFGILVQGIEVNPLEWMDKKWIQTRITDVITKAKKVIDTQ